MGMKNAELIQRLRVQLKQLEQEVLQHDSQLVKGQRNLLQDTERFNEGLFNQTGAQLAPCIGQLSKKISQLEKTRSENYSQTKDIFFITKK